MPLRPPGPGQPYELFLLPKGLRQGSLSPQTGPASSTAPELMLWPWRSAAHAGFPHEALPRLARRIPAALLQACLLLC